MKNPMKKLLLAVTATSIVATSIVGLTGCQKPAPTKTTQPTATEIFSMAAASGATFLDGSVANSSAVSSSATTRPDGITQANVDDLTKYLAMFNNMLANGGINVNSTSPTEEDGEYASYETKLVVSIDDYSYTVYYTEKAGDKVIEAEDDDDEVTESTTLTGVMVSGDTVYDVTGGRVVETEGDETETTVFFETKEVDGVGFVKVEQSHEVEGNETETEFEYTIKDKNGEETSYSIEWEFEDGKTEMEVSIENGTSEIEFEVEAVSETKFVITKSTETATSETELVIDVEKISDNEYKFTYRANGYSESVFVNAPEADPVA